jgi:hypothetical protein
MMRERHGSDSWVCSWGGNWLIVDTYLPKTGTPQAYESRMVKKDETAFGERLEAIAAPDEGGASC